MPNSGVIRAFLAIEPPEAVLRKVSDLQNRLRKLLDRDIRWTRPEGIHLTIKFLGDIFTSRSGDITAAAGEAAALFAPFDFSICGLGLFPDKKRARVLYIGAAGDTERLAEFHFHLEEILAGQGYPREGRAFRPHLTLARIISPPDTKELARALEENGNSDGGSFRASGLSFFKSDLTPGGAVYTKLATLPFTGDRRTEKGSQQDE